MGQSHHSRRDTRRTGADTIHRHRATRCPVTGKVRYRDAHQAMQALMGTKRRAARDMVHTGSTTHREVRFYVCSEPACGGGRHLTSAPAQGMPDPAVRRRLAAVARVRSSR